MKNTNLIGTAFLAVAVFAVFVASGPLPSSAGQSAAVICPTGFVCTPTVPATTVKCPDGYVCTRISSADTSASNDYVAGSWFNMMMGRSITDTQVPRSSTVIPTATMSVNSTVIPGTTSASAASTAATSATASSTWWNSIPKTAPTEKCAATLNHKLNTTGIPSIECSQYTTDQVNSMGLDPYWTNKSDPAGYVGEASLNANYVNPWLSASNPLGIVYAPYNGKDPSSIASNLCKNAVSLTAAKNLLATQPNILNASNLYVFGPGNMLWHLEVYGAQVKSGYNNPSSPNFGSGTTMYSWDGTTPSHPMNALDWYKPAFQALVQDYPPFLQSGITSTDRDYTGLARCLDAGFKSNYPQWSGHFQGTTMTYLKAQGLVL